MLNQTIHKNYTLAIYLCLCFLTTSLFLPYKIFAQQGEEYVVKAAFVLNFAKVTKWPDNAFDDSPGTIDLCLAGDKSLLEAFPTIDGMPIGQRTLRVRPITTANDCLDCEILFISSNIDRAALLRFFAAIKNRPVLIIGEIPDFARIGGVINFINKNGSLHFEINPKEAEQKGLKISSRILRLATIVENN